MKMTAVLVCALTMPLWASCGAGETADPSSGVTLIPGKSDESTGSVVPAFDESDDLWAPVEECIGYGLCLDVLVAGRDRSDFEAESFGYPMQRVIDELFFASDLQVSPNCKGRLGFDAEGNVGCAPKEDDAFIFGHVTDRRDGADSTWQWIEYDYATVGRARMFHHSESNTYYLDLR